MSGAFVGAAAVSGAQGSEQTKDADYIDVHGHCYAEHECPVNGMDPHCTPEELIAFYDMHGVKRGTILPNANPEGTSSVQSNEEVLRICRQYDRFIPFCNIDPRAVSNDWHAPLGDMFKYYRDKGCRGIGEVSPNLHFLDPRMQNLFKGAEEAGLPLTFHIAPFEGCAYGIVDAAGLPELEVCLQRFPKLKFFGHSQAFWCEMAAYADQDTRFGYPEGPIREEGAIPRLMRKYPNLYGDLSANSGANALIRDRAYGIKFLNEFQDRLMFGMDLCQPKAERSFKPLLPPYLKELRDSGEISNEVFEKVARGNAIRELKL